MRASSQRTKGGAGGRTFSDQRCAGCFQRLGRRIQKDSAVASDSAANAVVVWSGYGEDGDLVGVFGQVSPLGDFSVRWEAHDSNGNGRGQYVQRFDSSGRSLGPTMEVPE